MIVSKLQSRTPTESLCREIVSAQRNKCDKFCVSFLCFSWASCRWKLAECFYSFLLLRTKVQRMKQWPAVLLTSLHGVGFVHGNDLKQWHFQIYVGKAIILIKDIGLVFNWVLTLTSWNDIFVAPQDMSLDTWHPQSERSHQYTPARYETIHVLIPTEFSELTPRTNGVLGCVIHYWIDQNSRNWMPQHVSADAANSCKVLFSLFSWQEDVGWDHYFPRQFPCWLTILVSLHRSCLMTQGGKECGSWDGDLYGCVLNCH